MRKMGKDGEDGKMNKKGVLSVLGDGGPYKYFDWKDLELRMLGDEMAELGIERGKILDLSFFSSLPSVLKNRFPCYY